MRKLAYLGARQMALREKGVLVSLLKSSLRDRELFFFSHVRLGVRT